MNIELLKKLCEMPGAPGRENRVRDLIKSEITGLFDSVETDPLGSLICTRKATQTGSDKPLSVMLLCHMDEIGFIVSHICEKGFIYVDQIGGFDARNLFSRRVLVCTDGGDYKAVMNPAGKPIHIQSPEEAKKQPTLSEFYIDTGMGADTLNKVKIGDYVVMDEPFIEIGDKVVSKALDNRIACWLGIEITRALAKKDLKHTCDIHVVFTAQEEVGLRGAKTASYAIKPDIGIGIDTTLAVDTPGVPAQLAITRLGEGAGLCVKDGSFIPDIGLVKGFESIAEKNNIKTQRFVLPRGGMDGAAAQQAAGGARAMGIQVGTRYIHTVTEMIAKDDLQGSLELITAYLADL